MSDYQFVKVGVHRMLICDKCTHATPIHLMADLTDMQQKCPTCGFLLLDNTRCYGCHKTRRLNLMCDRCRSRYCDKCWNICYINDDLDQVPEDELPVKQGDGKYHVDGCDPCLNGFIAC